MTTRAKSALALISTPVLNYRQARKCFSPICCSRKFIEIYVEISPGFCYNIDVSLCSREGVKNPRWQADTWDVNFGSSQIFDGKGLDSHAE